MNRFIKNTFSFSRRHQDGMVFILIVFVYAIYGYFFSPHTFYFDSGNYWSLRESFLGGQGWSILNYTDSLRGYLFPLILLTIDSIVPDQIFSSYLVVVIFNATIMSVITVFQIPSIISSLSSYKTAWYQKITLALLLFIFWRGYIFYPLTDFLAFSFLLGAIFFFVNIEEENNNIASNLFDFLLVGLFSGAAYYIRPVYLVSIVVILLGAFYRFVFIYTSFQRGIAQFAGLLLGLIFVAVPQYLINTHNLNMNTPFISRNLYSFQLTTGFKVQKYETNVNEAIYDRAQIYFMDHQAENIAVKERNLGSPIEVINGKTLLRLFKKYPFDMTAIYFRHLFNGLNITYHTPYISNIYKLDIVGMMFNYTILFFLLFLFQVRSVQVDVDNLLIAIMSIILPVLVALPGAVEVRFFLPLHLLIYSIFIVFLSNFSNTWHDMSKDKNILARIIIFYIVFITALLSFSSIISTTIPDSTILLLP